jgi:hypothetical protein
MDMSDGVRSSATLTGSLVNRGGGCLPRSGVRSTIDRRALGTTHGVADDWCTTLMTFVRTVSARPETQAHRWAVGTPSRGLNTVTRDGRLSCALYLLCSVSVAHGHTVLKPYCTVLCRVCTHSHTILCANTLDSIYTLNLGIPSCVGRCCDSVLTA